MILRFMHHNNILYETEEAQVVPRIGEVVQLPKEKLLHPVKGVQHDYELGIIFIQVK